MPHVPPVPVAHTVPPVPELAHIGPKLDEVPSAPFAPPAPPPSPAPPPPPPTIRTRICDTPVGVVYVPLPDKNVCRVHPDPAVPDLSETKVVLFVVSSFSVKYVASYVIVERCIAEPNGPAASPVLIVVYACETDPPPPLEAVVLTLPSCQTMPVVAVKKCTPLDSVRSYPLTPVARSEVALRLYATVADPPLTVNDDVPTEKALPVTVIVPVTVAERVTPRLPTFRL